MIDALEAIVDVALSGSRSIGEQFTEPDADWRTMAFIGMPSPEESGAQAMIAVMDIGAMMSDKDEVSAFLAMSCQQAGAFAFAMVASSWLVDYQREGVSREVVEEEIERDPSPAQHPRRQEILMVVAMTKDEVVHHIARIERHEGQPPTLGEWNEGIELPEKARMEGRFVQPIQAALVEVPA